MKRLGFYLLFTTLFIAFALYILNNPIDSLITERSDLATEQKISVFTDEEIRKLSDYESDLYLSLGSTENSENAARLFSYFDIPESVKNEYTFSFYLLEFRHLRELHAFGQNPDKTNSFVTVRILNERFPDS